MKFYIEFKEGEEISPIIGRCLCELKNNPTIFNIKRFNLCDSFITSMKMKNNKIKVEFECNSIN